MTRVSHRLGASLVAVAIVLAGPAALADLDQGMTYFKSGKYMEAAAEFQALVDTSPSYDYGFYMMGLSFLQMKKTADAEKNFLQAIELNGEKFEYHHSLARAYFDQNEYAKSIATLKTAEGLVGDNKTKQYHLYNLRGLSYAAYQKWGDAVEDLEKARAIKATPAILDRLGAAYYELGYNDKALPVIQESLKMSPNNPANQLRLTNIYLNLGAESTDDAKKDANYKRAQVSAEKYLQMKPGAEGHNLVGRAALGANDYPAAEAAFRKVLAADSTHCYAMANLGKTYNAQQRWADAAGIFADAAKCAPRMGVVYEGWGFALQKQNRLTEAINKYEQAQKIKPNSFIAQQIEVCQTNLQIAADNAAMSEEEKRNEAEIKAEAERLAAERAKQKAWEEARKKDD